MQVIWVYICSAVNTEWSRSTESTVNDLQSTASIQSTVYSLNRSVSPAIPRIPHRPVSRKEPFVPRVAAVIFDRNSWASIFCTVQYQSHAYFQLQQRKALTMMFYCHLLLLLLIAGTSFCSEVVVLDTSNFEKLTQASTGHTTGDWLVKVQIPLLPSWLRSSLTFSCTPFVVLCTMVWTLQNTSSYSWWVSRWGEGGC